MASYVVVDLEMCTVPKRARESGFKYGSELIQIGAVMLDEEFVIRDSFMTYVAPEYGTINGFIRRLTGITRRHTEGAPSTREALERFADWLPDDARLVAWSGNDRAQIEHEILGKHLSIPRLDGYMSDDRWVDCQVEFARKMDTSYSFRLSEALLLADVEYDDGAHDALVDARNTARIFAKVRGTCDFAPSPYLVRSDRVTDYTFNPFRKVACARVY
ncbi:MAG: exonuclease domain-containing protein [Clostridia bacterium]|nr:exonuclease domain-containing protein [Clostridia bacterium]